MVENLLRDKAKLMKHPRMLQVLLMLIGKKVILSSDEDTEGLKVASAQLKTFIGMVNHQYPTLGAEFSERYPDVASSYSPTTGLISDPVDSQ